MRLIVLGSGTSFGVPQIGCECRVCRSSDPRDRRSRVAAVVEGDEGGRLLIDTPPELRLQLLSAGIGSLDAVLYTHEHADHLHGIDDLRAISVKQGKLPVYGPEEMLRNVASRFGYIFDASEVYDPATPRPQLELIPLASGVEVKISGMSVLPLELDHGRSKVFGYRIGRLAYLTDVKRVPSAVVERLRGVEVLVLNALFEHPHPAHLSIPEAVEVARAVGAKRTLLTHLTHKFAHAELASRLPAGVEPAYDGLTVLF
ncbi:MAG: MBL fold metallo-hydrolase [Gemmatimonadales bacterium]|nr:MAG: MBL fold metallo-hydrolase [Gemmatimonadales bacterium]